MKERDESQQAPRQDPLLGTPAEANTEKHINFLDAEDDSNNNRPDRREDNATEERQNNGGKALKKVKEPTGNNPNGITKT